MDLHLLWINPGPLSSSGFGRRPEKVHCQELLHAM
jgi:hypothetical protein